MRIKELKPRIPTIPALPQCSAKIDDPIKRRGWRQQYYEKRTDIDSTRCVRNSTIELNGRPYCRLHAGSIAIDILLALKE